MFLIRTKVFSLDRVVGNTVTDFQLRIKSKPKHALEIASDIHNREIQLINPYLQNTIHTVATRRCTPAPSVSTFRVRYHVHQPLVNDCGLRCQSPRGSFQLLAKLILINCFYRLCSGTKIKVKLSPCLTKHHAMKVYWGSGGIAPRILDLGTRWR
jgi:hypothetical protein